MESYGSHAQRTHAASRLTQLYTDTKHSSQAAVPKANESSSPEKRSFDRKYCIQKDRLIAWGFDWTDNLNDGDIDQSVQRAGLSEIVESIMENIKSIIEDVERMNAAGPPQSQTSFATEKMSTESSQVRSWMPADLAQYEDLIKDMTVAIDLLCDMSKSRRATQEEALAKADEASGKSGKKRPSSYQQPLERPPTPVPAYPSEASQVALSHQATESQLDSGMANPSDGPYNIPKISPTALVLPQEGPPGYGDSRAILRGASSSPRLFGHLRRSSPSESFNAGPDQSLLPVMVEYANFDRLYRVPGMELPVSSRLQQLHSILRTWDSSESNALARPIAYFEDPEHARYGLIFERPYSRQPNSQQAPETMFPAQPTTLSTLLHQASKFPSQVGSANAPSVPPLEDRFRLAQQLVLGFRFLQQHEFSHRNVSSSNIAVLPTSTVTPQGAFDIRRPLICSVDLFSDYDVDPSPEILQQNIYRHPDDPRIRGPTAAPVYETRFDLYSLSLVLLEIGMWHPLSDLYKEKYSLKDFKTRVEKVWIRRLAGRCGSAYTRCVQDLFEAGSKPKDSSRTMQVLNRVAARLDRCCAIELEEDGSDVEQTTDVASPSAENTYSTNLMSRYTGENLVSEPRSMSADELSGGIEKAIRPSQRMLFQDLELPKDIIAQYQAFEGQVVRITEKILKTSQESCWIDLLYSGEDKASARPTICVGCSSTKLVRGALKKYLQYDRNLFDLAVFKDEVRRSKSTQFSRSKGGENEVLAQNPDHYQRPLCGSSVGAWRFGEHSPAVSFGGVVMVDNEPYGMTVHHLLEDPEPEYESSSKTSKPVVETNTQAPELVEDDDDDSDDEDSTTDEQALLDLDESDDEDNDDEFTDGVPTGQMDQMDQIVLTQPALDDVEEGFFPNEEDEDDEHLLSHRLGYVHASSGLRRLEMADGIKHEIDWLLMKLDANRLQPYNVIPGGKRFCHEDSLFRYRPKLIDPICRPPSASNPLEDLYPRTIAPSAQLPGLAVHSIGRTSGLGSGTLSNSMRWVRFHGRRTFSQVWSVIASDFGQGGDSGAWVVDNIEGRVCGHVLAWSNRFGVAYVAPMDVMIEDMRRTLGATRIALPGVDEQPRPISAGFYELDANLLNLDDSSRQQNLLARQ